MNCTNIYTNNGSIISSVKASNEAFHKRLKRLYPCVDDVTTLPQTWSSESKAPALGLTHNKLGCYFRGNGRREEDDKFAAAVRTDNFIPPACLLYYYEIRFISKGREGFMGLGLTSKNALLTKLPGWVRESYGYHADDGNIFNGDGRGSPFGPTFTTGDVIGCGFNLVEGKCFFTKNGLNLGKAFEDIPSNILFYPTVGLKTPGEDVEANFGQNEFVYDIEQDLRSLRKNMTLSISNFPITDFGNWQNTLHKLVQSWLLQNSYPNTAEAFTRATKLDCKENIQRVQIRSSIQQLVLSGRISEAINATNHLCPNLLQNNPNLLFALKCRQFIELISGAESDFQPIFDYSNQPIIGNNNNNNKNGPLVGDNNNSNGIISNNNLSKTSTTTKNINVGQTSSSTTPPPPPPSQPSDATTTTSNTRSTTATATTSLNTSDDIDNGHGVENNGCNGMIGDNNCEKVDDQHSTSSSSYQELMDIDQPQIQANLNAATNSNSNNDTKNNHHHHHHHQQPQPQQQHHHHHHREQLTYDGNNHQQPRHSTSLNGQNHGQQQQQQQQATESGDQLLLTKCSSSGGVAGSLSSQNVPTEDREMDSDEQKYAKLIHFGQELCDYMTQLDKLYGKNETNERMLREAISLIAVINPRDSYLAELLDPSEREPISQLLDSSILKAEMGDTYKPPLEEVMSHLKKLVRLNDSQGRWLIDNLY